MRFVFIIDLPLKMKYLLLIRWNKLQRFRLIEHVSAAWRTFGGQIEITENTMDGWHRETQGKAEECWGKVMKAWLNGQGKRIYPHSWAGLCELLEDVNFRGIVPELMQAVKNNCEITSL